MSENKRKRHGDESNGRPSKRVATEQPSPEVVKVSLMPDEDEWAPVVGMILRNPTTSSTGKSPITNSEHLVHTSAHPRIDYTGREEDGGGTEGLLSHYIGVYDPRSGDLQLMRARKLVLRGSPRFSPTELEQEAKAANDRSARTALGLAFGTKKSKRALQNLAKNAISPSKKGLPAAEGSQPTLDPVAAAVISSMAIAAPS
ncbi:MAG: hypothetical protein L6R42_005584, partial [Xanthoria sp. 1 TBL-2021]